MNKTAKKIVITKIATSGYLYFDTKEIAKLREVIRVSIGKYADDLTEEDLSEFGTSMLLATAVVLKARYAQSNNLPIITKEFLGRSY